MSPLAGQAALLIAAIFTGAAIYINAVEHPARLRLDDTALLRQWQPSYKRGFVMQSSLAILGFLAGLLAWWQAGHLGWLLGAALMIANWPFTLLAIMPTNHQLMAVSPAEAGPGTRGLLLHWGRLHAVRSALGFAACAVFLWASLG